MTDAVFESHVPSPIRSTVTQFGLRISPTKALRKLEPGQSMIVDNKRARQIMVSAAYRLDISIQTAKEGEKYRIWRKA